MTVAPIQVDLINIIASSYRFPIYISFRSPRNPLFRLGRIFLQFKYVTLSVGLLRSRSIERFTHSWVQRARSKRPDVRLE